MIATMDTGESAVNVKETGLNHDDYKRGANSKIL
jgi:hypothetical protein